MPIFTLFASAGVLFEDYFFLWVSLSIPYMNHPVSMKVVIYAAIWHTFQLYPQNKKIIPEKIF